MSCTLPHECRVMLSSLLTASSDATRVWLRAEMDRTVDRMLDSIFNRLTTKLTNGLERTQSGYDGDNCSQVRSPNQNLQDQCSNSQIHQRSTFNPQHSTLSHFNPQLSNQPQNGTIHLNFISNPKLSNQFNPMKIEEENEPMPSSGQSSWYTPVSNEQLNRNWNDNDECVDERIEVKEEDADDDQVDEESSRSVKRPKMDTTQPNNAQVEVARQSTRKPTDETQLNESNEEGDRMEIEQSEVIDTRATIEHFDHGQHNSDESMVIQQEEMDANNAIGDESRASECTTNPIQPNHNLQCSLCHKSFDCNYNFTRHLRVHTGERPFPCDQCDKQFKDSGTLAKHQLIHQNIKNFQCNECEKQFSRKDHFDSHLRIHSGERPFKCRHCEKSFIQSNIRNRHEQAIHLHMKPYRCKQCGHTATLRSDIIRHIRVVHFGLPPTIKQQRALNIIDDRDPKMLVEKV